MTQTAAAIVLLLVGLAVLALVRGWFADRGRAGTTPVGSAGGFASKRQLRKHLSAQAVRKAGAQVRPSLHLAAKVGEGKGKRDG